MSTPDVTENFEQLGERTWVWHGDLGRHEQTNVGVIVDERSVIVVDANFEWAARRIAASISERFHLPVSHVVNTHYHVDHSLGNAVFADGGATIVGAQGQRAELLEKGPDDARIQVGEAQQRFVPAGMEFRGNIHFPFSGANLISLEPAHTAADVLVWIPSDSVLFVGDLAVAWNHGNNFSDADADIDGWLRALAQCLALHPRIVVPAHGEVSETNVLVRQRAFIQDLWEWSLTSCEGKDVELDSATAEGFMSQHPDFAIDSRQLREMAGSTVDAARRVRLKHGISQSEPEPADNVGG